MEAVFGITKQTYCASLHSQEATIFRPEQISVMDFITQHLSVYTAFSAHVYVVFAQITRITSVNHFNLNIRPAFILHFRLNFCLHHK